MRPRAASASSIEHSSGSDFISQWSMGEWKKWCPPLVPVGPASEPCLIRVVAYRPHQVHPARQVLKPGEGRSQQWHSGPQPGEAIGSENMGRSEEHTSELQSQSNLVCRLLLEKKK